MLSLCEEYLSTSCFYIVRTIFDRVPQPLTNLTKCFLWTSPFCMAFFFTVGAPELPPFFFIFLTSCHFINCLRFFLRAWMVLDSSSLSFELSLELPCLLALEVVLSLSMSIVRVHASTKVDGGTIFIFFLNDGVNLQ